MLLSLVCVCLVYYNRYTKVIESKRKERIKKSKEKKMHTERSSTTNYVLRMHRQCVLCRPCAVCHFIGQKKNIKKKKYFFCLFHYRDWGIGFIARDAKRQKIIRDASIVFVFFFFFLVAVGRPIMVSTNVIDPGARSPLLISSSCNVRVDHGNMDLMSGNWIACRSTLTFSWHIDWLLMMPH